MKYHELQKAAGLSNSQTAELFAVNRSTVKRWRDGTIRVPKAVILVLQSIISGKAVETL